MRIVGFVAFAVVCGGAFASAPAPRTLTFDDRVKAQRAIEEVYWRHRIWPKANAQTKPPLSAVLSEESIRAKVEDYLKKSSALEKYWQRPVTTEQLQAEMDRMVANTHEGQVLGELFAALKNDPFVIGETLARPTLVDRLIRNWYATDSRFHSEAKTRAEKALAACDSAACTQSMSAEYFEITWALRGDGGDRTELQGDRVIRLDRKEWNDRLARLSSGPEVAPTRLEESADAFTLTTVRGRGTDWVTTGTLAWRKQSFDSWWNRQRGGIAVSAGSAGSSFVLPKRIAATCAYDSWQPTFVDVPEGRNNHTAVWTGSEMIVWGGENGQDLDTGWRYTPSTDSWVAMPVDPSMPSVRQHHTAVWTGTEMIVWGGTYYDYVVQAYKVLNTGGRYDPATNVWVKTSMGTNVPSGRSDHTAVWTGSEMIVWGGGEPGSVSLNTGGRYSPSTDSWGTTSIGANVPEARKYHTAVWTGDEMIVWGGSDPPSPQYLKTGGRYSPATDTWLPTSVGANVPLERRWHTAIWTGEEMVVWAGYKRPDRPGPEELNSGGRYKPTTDTWESTSTGANVPNPGHFHTAVWTGSEMIVWGGTSGDNTVGRYSPSSDTWAASSAGANVPAGRENHTAVWTGTEMIVWGGGSNTGGRYNPTTDSWVATSTQSIVPDPRSNHTAIWTGAEMIVWGGDGDLFPYFLNTGGRYEPATDTWTPTSTGMNVPHGRRYHSAIWTGTEMIVWGGFYYDYDHDSFNWVNTGGRYDPSTDSWAPTSTGAIVPVGRAQHTAVWTGTEMVVWGGGREPNTVGLNTGGRYDPSTDSWAATSTSNGAVPSARYVHTAVWTGTEMIVWGGNVSNASGTVLNTGGRYKPSTDSWSATSTTTSNGVVVPRSGHTAVWTGAEMILWGGWGGVGAGNLDTGDRYNPSTDSWSVSSASAGVPQARGAHQAVWTGSKMIIWGGYVDGIGTNTGGRYDPSIDGWMPTSSGPNVPTERGALTAVWTDREMIVWGGYNSRSLRTGGRYSLCQVFFRDADGDGHGDPAIAITTYDDSVPPGYVTNSSDCNDASPTVHPGAPEVCDQLDNDCNGTIDEDALGVDTDRDGVRNACDNCRFAFNPDQRDTDGDGLGNVCDDRLHRVPGTRTDNQ